MAGHWRGGDLHVFRFDPGESFPGDLLALLERHGVRGGLVSAIGAFERATLAYFDAAERRYVELPVEEQVEVVSLAGNVASLEDGRPFAHLHVALSRRDGSVVAGHLREGTVRPTLEVVVQATERPLRRVVDPETGLGRLDLSG